MQTINTQMLLIIVVACLIVFGAMLIDLISGLYKAKQRGEVRSSWGLKRSLNKFIAYEGGMLIAAGVDILIYMCHLTQLLGFESLSGVPFVTCMIGIFLCIVEMISVREKADQKTKTEFARVQKLAESMVNKNDLVEALTKAIIEARKADKDHGES